MHNQQVITKSQESRREDELFQAVAKNRVGYSSLKSKSQSRIQTSVSLVTVRSNTDDADNQQPYRIRELHFTTQCKIITEKVLGNCTSKQNNLQTHKTNTHLLYGRAARNSHFWRNLPYGQIGNVCD